MKESTIPSSCGSQATDARTNALARPARACPCCGLVQTVPAIPPRMRACCCRCGRNLVKRARILRSNSRTAAIALAALILYPLAISLPMVTIERFGHHAEHSIFTGTKTLLTSNHVVIGLIVLSCSIVLPLGKLLALLVLSLAGLRMRREHRVWTYHLVEWTGRWGMLDVLLVAILVAAVQIGELAQISAGPAVLIFAGCVALSLCATVTFDPHGPWESETNGAKS